MTEKVAQQEESLYPDPEMPADTPVAQRLCLSRLSTLPSPSWPIRCPMYSLGFVLYKLRYWCVRTAWSTGGREGNVAETGYNNPHSQVSIVRPGRASMKLESWVALKQIFRHSCPRSFAMVQVLPAFALCGGKSETSITATSSSGALSWASEQTSEHSTNANHSPVLLGKLPGDVQPVEIADWLHAECPAQGARVERQPRRRHHSGLSGETSRPALPAPAFRRGRLPRGHAREARDGQVLEVVQALTPENDELHQGRSVVLGVKVNELLPHVNALGVGFVPERPHVAPAELAVRVVFIVLFWGGLLT